MYETYYGLKESPFRLAPDPKFFFENGCHKRALSYLRYGLHQAQGFVVVTGVPGTGKSLLVQTLFSELAGRRMVIASISNTNLCDTDILRAVANAFDIHCPEDHKAGLLGTIERFLIEQRRQGKHVLLIVDEAQNVPRKSLEELRMLTNFQSGENALIQIMLLGQQQLQKILSDPAMEQLTQRVIASCHLAPLDAQEMRSYIEHRLLCAGWQGRPSFSCEALQSIYHYTRGVPRLINNFCDRLLLAACLDEKNEIDQAHLNTVMNELKEEATGVWGMVPEADPSCGELKPLPDGEVASLEKAAAPSAEVEPDEPSVTPEPVVSETTVQAPMPAANGGVVVPDYTHSDELVSPKKKSLFGFGKDKDEYPEFSPSSLLDEGKTAVGRIQSDDDRGVVTSPDEVPAAEASVNEVAGGEPKEASPESPVANVADESQYPQDNPFDPDTGRYTEESATVQEESPRARDKSNTWVMLAVVGVAVMVGLGGYMAMNDMRMGTGISDQQDQHTLPATVTQTPVQAEEEPLPLNETTDLPDELESTPEQDNPEPDNHDEPVDMAPVVEPESALQVEPAAPLEAPTPVPTSAPKTVVEPAKTKAAPLQKKDEPKPVPVPIVEPVVTARVVPPADDASSALSLPPTLAEPVVQTEPVSEVGAVAEAEQGGIALSDQASAAEKAEVNNAVVIKDFELPDFVYSFSFAYESGNIDQFIGLFTASAEADGSRGRDNIAKDYQELFYATDMRSMDVNDVKWQVNGSSAEGQGQFEVTVWRHGNVTPSTVKGDITLGLIKQEERLYIQRLSLESQ